MRATSSEYQNIKRPNVDWGFKGKAEEKDAKKSEGFMPIDEAINILQVPATFTAEEVEQRFEKLFNLNDPAKGGSFFIQCKVRGAKITLIKHLEPEPSAPETTEGESDPKPNENKETNN